MKYSETFNHNPYNLPKYKKKEKIQRIPDTTPSGRKQFQNFKIIVEDIEAEILESILKACTDSEYDQFIKSIVERILQRYKENNSKPLTLNKETSDLLHSIFIPRWE
jgi:hypothetical protein